MLHEHQPVWHWRRSETMPILTSCFPRKLISSKWLSSQQRMAVLEALTRGSSCFAMQSIVDWGQALPLLTAAQQVALRKLAVPEIGLACIGDIGEGLCRYLSPHCEKNAAGNLYLVPVEVRIALKVRLHPILPSADRMQNCRSVRLDPNLCFNVASACKADSGKLKGNDI